MQTHILDKERAFQVAGGKDECTINGAKTRTIQGKEGRREIYEFLLSFPLKINSG